MKAVLGRGNHWLAFSLTVSMTMAGFMVIPYISPFLVANLGISNESLPLIYLFGGGATFFSMRWIGKMSDRLGHFRVFTVMSLTAMLPILALSHLPRIPLWGALLVTTFFMVFVSGRFIPGMAMVTNSVEARYRGGFMSLNSAAAAIRLRLGGHDRRRHHRHLPGRTACGITASWAGWGRAACLQPAGGQVPEARGLARRRPARAANGRRRVVWIPGARGASRRGIFFRS